MRDLDRLPRPSQDALYALICTSGKVIELRRGIDWDGDRENARRRFRRGVLRRGYLCQTWTEGSDLIFVVASLNNRPRESK